MGESGDVAMPADSKQKSSSKEDVIPVAEPHKLPKVQTDLFTIPVESVGLLFKHFSRNKSGVCHFHFANKDLK